MSDLGSLIPPSEDFSSHFALLASSFSGSTSLPPTPQLAPLELEDDDDPADANDDDSATNSFSFGGFSYQAPSLLVPAKQTAAIDKHYRRFINFHSSTGDLVATLQVDEDLYLTSKSTGSFRDSGGVLILFPGVHSFSGNPYMFFVVRSLDV
jgi:hypothetical protein